jgi:hypothetical protein
MITRPSRTRSLRPKSSSESFSCPQKARLSAGMPNSSADREAAQLAEWPAAFTPAISWGFGLYTPADWCLLNRLAWICTGGSSFHGGSLANYLASTSLAVSQPSCLSLSAQTGGDLLVCRWLANSAAALGREARSGRSKKSEARMRVSGPLTNTGTAPLHAARQMFRSTLGLQSLAALI